MKSYIYILNYYNIPFRIIKEKYIDLFRKENPLLGYTLYYKDWFNSVELLTGNGDNTFLDTLHNRLKLVD